MSKAPPVSSRPERFGVVWPSRESRIVEFAVPNGRLRRDPRIEFERGGVKSTQPVVTHFATGASTHCLALLPGGVDWFDLVDGETAPTSGTPFVGPFLPRHRMGPLAELFVIVTLASGQRVRLIGGQPAAVCHSLLREDLALRFTDQEYGLHATIFSYSSSATSANAAMRLQLDVRYIRPGGGPWTLEVERVEWGIRFLDPSDSLSSHCPNSIDFVYDPDSKTAVWTWHTEQIGHAQRPGFEVGLNVGDKPIAPREWETTAIYSNWLADCSDRNQLLTVRNCFESGSPTRLREKVLAGIQKHRVKNDPIDGWALRPLEGNEYSAATGGGWDNMGRMFHYSLLRCGGEPAQIMLDAMRQGAEGLTLLRIHNVCERDGSVLRFASHLGLRTNRQIVHSTSKDMLTGGGVPADRGVYNRNARDLQHYEINPALFYLALRLDHQIRESVEQMIEIDYSCTYLLNGYMQTGRGLGRPIAAWCAMAKLFPHLRSGLAAMASAFVRVAAEKWEGKQAIAAWVPPQPVEGQEVVKAPITVIKQHSVVNGFPMFAVYEESLAGQAFLQFAETFPDLPEAAVARAMGDLLCLSVLRCFRGDVVSGFTVPYLAEIPQTGEPLQERDKAANGYAKMCVGAVDMLVADRSGADTLRQVGGSALTARAEAIIEWWSDVCRATDDVRDIHWSAN